MSKLKAFADDIIIMIQILKFVLGWVENILRKGENTGYQSSRSLKVVIVRESTKGLLVAIFLRKGENGDFTHCLTHYQTTNF